MENKYTDLVNAVKAYQKAKKHNKDVTDAWVRGEVSANEQSRISQVEVDRWEDVEHALKAF